MVCVHVRNATGFGETLWNVTSLKLCKRSGRLLLTTHSTLSSRAHDIALVRFFRCLSTINLMPRAFARSCLSSSFTMSKWSLYGKPPYIEKFRRQDSLCRSCAVFEHMSIGMARASGRPQVPSCILVAHLVASWQKYNRNRDPASTGTPEGRQLCLYTQR